MRLETSLNVTIKNGFKLLMINRMQNSKYSILNPKI